MNEEKETQGAQAQEKQEIKSNSEESPGKAAEENNNNRKAEENNKTASGKAQGSSEQQNNNSEQGNTEEYDFLSQVREEREKLEKATDNMRKAMSEQKKLIAEQEMQGKGFSGKKEEKQETPREYAKRVMSGQVEKSS